MWTGSDHDNDLIDHAIDEVAQRMTDRALTVNFKAHVLSRLNERGYARSRWRLVWIAAPLAAAAIVALIVFVRADRGGETRAPQPSLARASDQTLPLAPRQEPAPALNQPDALHSRGVAAFSRTSVAPPQRAASDIERMAPPPLAVPSIAVPPLPIRDMPTPSIAVEPLETIAPIAVSPIGEGDRP